MAWWLPTVRQKAVELVGDSEDGVLRGRAFSLDPMQDAELSMDLL